MPRTVALSQNGVWVGMRLWPKVATPTCGRSCSGETQPVAAVSRALRVDGVAGSRWLHSLYRRVEDDHPSGQGPVLVRLNISSPHTHERPRVDRELCAAGRGEHYLPRPGQEPGRNLEP